MNPIYPYICIILIFIIYIYLYYHSETWSYFGYTNYIGKSVFIKGRQPYILDAVDLDCEKSVNKPGNDTDFLNYLKNRKFPENVEYKIRNSEDMCAKVKEFFYFPETPMSREEADYPLAYGILAYKDIVQVLFMLSSFYHPQNEYCFAVSENAGKPFSDLLEDLSDCWPNVYFMKRPKITWGSHEVINSVYATLEFLSNLNSTWMYFQYLSGVDVPLKTNLEMVRIFKALNGTPNMELKNYQENRLNGKNITDSPIPLYKSSLSSLIPRKTADAIVASNTTQNLLNFLNGTSIPDEAFWGSLLANKELLPVPGSISGVEWLKNQLKVRIKMPNIEESKPGDYYYISRHQVWYKNCKGRIQTGSCVYGIGDLPSLVKSHALVAHKLYMNEFPAAFFCSIREIQKRAADPGSYPFNTTFYETLPQVEWLSGTPLDKVTHPELVL